MKRIFYIARNDIYSLFYSPIAWIMIVLFLIFTSIDYISVMDFFLGCNERGGFSLYWVRDLTDNIIANPLFGYFPKLMASLYIFFPLITMGLISREVSSGTVKLLYSSPVRISEIVLGKYLSMVVFAFVLIAMCSFTVVCLSVGITRPDYDHIIASLGGLFLVLCTYASIGLFISSLTSYQIVAAIITLTVFALLSHIGEVWQDVNVLRDITYYMNIRGKSQDLLNGLINLRDIAYFLILITVFILFTIIRILSGMESISRTRKAFRYIVVIMVAFIIGYITNKPSVNVYYDTTRDKLHTITPPTQTMLQKLNDGPLEITVFSNLLWDFNRWRPSEQNNIINNIWEPYLRFKPDIHIKFVYYYNVDTGSFYYKANPGKSLEQIAAREAKSWDVSMDGFLTPREVQRLANVDKEENRSFFRLSYKGRNVILRVFDDIGYWPGENEIAASLNRLILSAPRICFLTDEIERGPFSDRTRDYNQITSLIGNRHALINQGYDFDTLSIKDREVPDNLAGLVIADPRAPFSTENLQKIARYIDAGGNLFVAGEPDRREVIKPLFDTLGISLRKGLLIQPNDKFSSDCVFSYLTDSARELSIQFSTDLKDKAKFSGDSLFRVAMGGAGALDYSGVHRFRVEPLLITDGRSGWNRIAPISNDSLQLKVKELPDDEKGRFTTAVYMERKQHGKDQRIIVATDADYLTKPLFDAGNGPDRLNYDFGFWCFSRFSYNKFPSNTLRPQTDDGIRINGAGLTTQKVLLYYVLPGLICAAGIIVLMRRKRK